MRRVLILLLVLGACGVKGQLDKPAEARYPRTYPAN
jgi:predicted small lipoprotein YifL